MRRLRKAALWAACAATAVFSGAASAQTQADDSALVERGAYLAKAGDCMPCHSGDPKKPFAGNLPFNTPFGTMFSVNITSDPAYGIGNWTYEQFKAALHDGIRADGAYLYPAMPFDAYTGIEESDLKALWAFVRRIPAIAEPRKENQLNFPFNVRLGLLAWRELFFEPAYFKPTTGKSDAWNRGAYLAQTLAHCADCHTPRNLMGAVKQKQNFLGTEVDGYWAPDISTEGLKKSGWTADKLTTFLKSGSSTGKTSVFGPMAEVVHDSLGFLTPTDLTALVTYLMDAPPPSDVPAPQAASPLPADVFQRAAKSYVDNCAPCHMSKGAGSTDIIPPLAGNPAVVASEPYNVIMAILGGLPSGGTYGPMPSFAGRLSDQQVADLVNYVRTSWGNKADPSATPAMVAAWRATANVPDFGTQQASAFDCPKVGGGPGSTGPDPKAVAAITQMMQGGNRQIHVLTAAYSAADSGATPDTVVDALTAAYCPVVATSSLPDWQKSAELRRFTLQVAADVSPAVAAVPMPDVSIVWATPVGTSLVARQPTAIAAKLTCPANDGKLVPKDLADKAVSLLGTPTPPVAGAAVVQLATTLSQQNPKARLSDVANALISAYCPLVVAQGGNSVAEQYNLLTGFGQQVVQTLQLSAPTVKASTK
ncbi:cytochrome c [Roseixanthobacter pseudopolyaromaticivorans]|uniref:cytochrome c n=1 Tax=Xanthobacteraceae TaxID=335928 RepID=UPI00372A9951